MNTDLPDELYEIYRWVEAGGELEILRDMPKSEIHAYALDLMADFHRRAPVAGWEGFHPRVHEVKELRKWLRANDPNAAKRGVRGKWQRVATLDPKSVMSTENPKGKISDLLRKLKDHGFKVTPSALETQVNLSRVFQCDGDASIEIEFSLIHVNEYGWVLSCVGHPGFRCNSFDLSDSQYWTDVASFAKTMAKVLDIIVDHNVKIWWGDIVTP